MKVMHINVINIKANNNGNKSIKVPLSNIYPKKEGATDMPINIAAFNQEARRPVGLIIAEAAKTYITVIVKKKYQIIFPAKKLK